ncbi:hypothetical protein F383_35793 [Gossypium arboreum]|uniref:Uncharacterized protein n=1 Tax=Gossypium arboreum TaxID=29729 RepID=A0A0B0PRK0_GOSAR|nr:hypothetical protein F383_35793 [Gossypium arboreum]
MKNSSKNLERMQQ